MTVTEKQIEVIQRNIFKLARPGRGEGQEASGEAKAEQLLQRRNLGPAWVTYCHTHAKGE